MPRSTVAAWSPSRAGSTRPGGITGTAVHALDARAPGGPGRSGRTGRAGGATRDDALDHQIAAVDRTHAVGAGAGGGARVRGECDVLKLGRSRQVDGQRALAGTAAGESRLVG